MVRKLIVASRFLRHSDFSLMTGIRLLEKILGILIRGLNRLNQMCRNSFPENQASAVNLVPEYPGTLAEFSILVTTFEKRFFSSALPLISDLRRLFADVPIYVFINGNLSGNHDRQLRDRFISELVKLGGIDFICNSTMTGISRNWNLGIQMAASDQVLCLSDDVWIGPSFPDEITEILKQNLTDGLSILGSFAAFIINKECISRVGWFDERFLGFGIEDGDYMWRFESVIARSPARYQVNSLKHYWLDSRGDEPADDNKYSLVNTVYCEIKYIESEDGIRGPFSSPKLKVINDSEVHSMEDYRRRARKALFCDDPDEVGKLIRVSLAP